LDAIYERAEVGLPVATPRRALSRLSWIWRAVTGQIFGHLTPELVAVAHQLFQEKRPFHAQASCRPGAARLAGSLCAAREQADSHADLSDAVVVGSIQTLHVARLERLPVALFKTIIMDETHRLAAATYRRILEHFSEAKVLGITATPGPKRGQNLSKQS
jgi:hypothetical protein